MLSSARCCSTKAAFQPIGRAMTAGFPAAVPPIICPNAWVYKDDWNCSTPSSSQAPAKVSCSTRRASVPGGAAAPARTHRRTRSRPRVSSVITAFPDRRSGYFGRLSISMVPSFSSVTYACCPLGSTAMLDGAFPVATWPTTVYVLVSITVTELSSLSDVKR